MKSIVGSVAFKDAPNDDSFGSDTKPSCCTYIDFAVVKDEDNVESAAGTVVATEEPVGLLVEVDDTPDLLVTAAAVVAVVAVLPHAAIPAASVMSAIEVLIRVIQISRQNF